MDQHVLDQYLSCLKMEIAPAMGCTEPAAVALATAHAASLLAGEPRSIKARVSAYVLKNGMNVGIPGTGLVGLEIAAALGSLGTHPEKQLMVLTGLSDAQRSLARRMVDERAVHVELANTTEKIHIDVEVTDGTMTTRAVISRAHTRLVLLERDGAVLFKEDDDPSPAAVQTGTARPLEMTLDEIHSFICLVPEADIEFLQEVVLLNLTMAKEGMENDYGLNVGRGMLTDERSGLYGDSLGHLAVALTAAAADARMAGCEKPVMSTAGSGNQGLTATVPIAVLADRMHKSREETHRALALSILVTVHAKRHIGKLSALCGCSIAAAIGTCAGIVHLLGGTLENVKSGIRTMVADISGVVCDGAKAGCALKIATAVESAIRAACLALNGIGAAESDGIVDRDVEKTLMNLGTLGNKGMFEANGAILDMMLDKHPA